VKYAVGYPLSLTHANGKKWRTVAAAAAAAFL